ncbi:hypothetical protein [Enterococcus devriesei]|uniref:hypothetical protein n=1 Tax=Enterococcus devriesei TaxID=319970 RepID=UPI0028AA4E10|nr:hypothetical protein [Enterococcus devriesei]
MSYPVIYPNVKRYLAKWAGFMEYRNELNEYEKRMAKIFFKALSVTSKEDIILLSEKYLDSNHKTQYSPEHDGYMARLPITDQTLSEKNNIELNEYRTRRNKAEYRLQKKLNKQVDEYEEEKRKILPKYVLRIGRLFFKRYELSVTRKVKEEIIFTQNISEAKIFTDETNEGEELAIGFGLTKEEPDFMGYK